MSVDAIVYGKTKSKTQESNEINQILILLMSLWSTIIIPPHNEMGGIDGMLTFSPFSHSPDVLHPRRSGKAVSRLVFWTTHSYFPRDVFQCVNVKFLTDYCVDFVPEILSL